MQGFIRIIAGNWRGRRLPVPTISGLRPTPDRVRETLFNWLSPIIEGSHCLDMFAGTGILGFEALSRGASQVVLVDASAKVIKTLEASKMKLDATHAEIYQAHAPQGLHPVKQPFDIVFIDPPYRTKAITDCCFYLEAHHFLAKLAHIYLEADHLIEDNELPPNWHISKKGRAGQVYYHLARRES